MTFLLRAAILAAIAVLALLPAPARVQEIAIAKPPALKPGTTWLYQQRDGFTDRDLGVVRIEVTAVDADGVRVKVSAPGLPQTVTERYDPAGNWQRVHTRGRDWLARLAGRSGEIAFAPALPLWRFPLQPGASWSETVAAVDPESGRATRVKIFAKALKWERIKVPAGEFLALKVRRTLYPDDADESRSRTTVSLWDWYAPEVGRSIRSIEDFEFHDARRAPADQVVKGARVRLELTELPRGS